MISEKTFASTFNSFWQEVMPTGEGFVRTMNLAKRHFNTPLKSRSDPKRRGLINELGFLLFKTSGTSTSSPKMSLESAETRADVIHRAVSTVQRYRSSTEDEVQPPNEEELEESLTLARRLAEFFKEKETGESMTLSPGFSGCGLIDNCEGDVLAGNTLYEVKSGDRPFRLVDVRQMVMYLALNYVGQQYQIVSVGFVNPRLGTYYKTAASTLALGISGLSLVDLTSEVAEFVSSGGVSR